MIWTQRLCALSLSTTDAQNSILFCYSPDSSGSESEDSSDDSESEEEVFKHGSRDIALSLEDANDDEDAPVQGPTAYTKTLNEVVEDYVVIPDISEIDPQEPMEKVGEISSILNNKVVVVKGLASKISVAERVLDSDTLLVFEDRKVMGFVSSLIADYSTSHSTFKDLRDFWTHVSASVSSPF